MRPLTWCLSRWAPGSGDGGEVPQWARRLGHDSAESEDSRTNPERLSLNFEGVPSGASANPRQLHAQSEPWFGARSKWPAHEGGPNNCTPQAPRLHRARVNVRKPTQESSPPASPT
jgi:hypothetical protein